MTQPQMDTPSKILDGFVFLEKKGGLMQHQRGMSEDSANKNTQQFSWPIGLKIWDFWEILLSFENCSHLL